MDYFLTAAWANERERMIEHATQRAKIGDSVNLHLLRELNDRFDHQMHEADVFARTRLQDDASLTNYLMPHTQPEPQTPSAAPVSPMSTTSSFFIAPPLTPRNIQTSSVGGNCLTWTVEADTARMFLELSEQMMSEALPSQVARINAMVDCCNGIKGSDSARKHGLSYGTVRSLINQLNQRGANRFMRYLLAQD